MDGKSATFDRTIGLGALSDVSVSSDLGNSSGVQHGRFQNVSEDVEIRSVQPSENVSADNTRTPQNTAGLTTENQSEECKIVTTDQTGSSLNCRKTSSTITSRSFDRDSKNSSSEHSGPEVPVVIITCESGESSENCSENSGSDITKNLSNEGSGVRSINSSQECENLDVIATENLNIGHSNPSLLDSSGHRIPTVIVTSDSDGLTDDDSIDKSVLNRLRYDSAGSGTSTELYATAYGYKSDNDSSCEDTEALYTAADWTEDSSADVRLDSNIPTIIDIDSSDCENSFEYSGAHSNKSDSSSSISHQGLDNLDSTVSNILIDSELSEGDPFGNIFTNNNSGASDSPSSLQYDLNNSSHQNSLQSQEIIVRIEPLSEHLTSDVDVVISEGGVEAQEKLKKACISGDAVKSSSNTPTSLIEGSVNHIEETTLRAERSVENQNSDLNVSSGSGLALSVDEHSCTSATKIEISDDLSPPDLPTCLDLSVEGVHIEEGNLEPNGNPSNSSYLVLESPGGTELSHDSSRAGVHSDNHLLDDNALTLLQSARDTRSGSSISKLQPVRNGGSVKTSNNIKDKLAMRRRRDDESGGDEVEEALMGAGDRRGSDEVSVGSHFEVRGDEWNIALLLWLYLLQGIPLGLTAAIPMIIQNRGVSFKQQAEFSFSMWPFSLKLLWAPLVDAVYYPSFGRRKTWLVPAQYLIGFFMVFLSFHINNWLSTDDPQVGLLTLLFFIMNFLAATQDIAVDGWALTMLKRQNRGLASMCNSVGQNAGFFLGYVVFIALESPEFCNKYLRSEPADEGLITLPGFLYFWGTVYLIMTTLVAFMKREAPESRESPSVRAAFGSYHLLLRILKLPNIQLFAFLLLTCKMGFAAFDGVTSLKFIEKGVPKDKLALVAVPLVPLQILLPILVTKMNHPRRPMELFLKAFPYRLAFNFVGALFVYITPLIIHGNADVPYYYYLLLIVILAIHQGATSAMFVQMMAFFAMVSDADAGGTYMTLLNTLANLGGTWTSTSALAAVDSFTWRSCVGSNLTATNDCANSALSSVCKEAGGTCVTDIDGYYVEIVILTIVGIVWFWYGRKKIDYLQSRPLSTWAVPRR